MSIQKRLPSPEFRSSLGDTINELDTFVRADLGATAAELAHRYAAIKTAVDQFEDTLAPLVKLRDHLKSAVIPEAFEREHISSFTTKDGYRVTVSLAVRASIKDKVKGYEWLKENKLEDIITETVNASTLSAVVKRRLDEGFDMPEEIFSVFLQPTTSITKVK